MARLRGRQHTAGNTGSLNNVTAWTDMSVQNPVSHPLSRLRTDAEFCQFVARASPAVSQIPPIRSSPIHFVRCSVGARSIVWLGIDEMDEVGSYYECHR